MESFYESVNISGIYKDDDDDDDNEQTPLVSFVWYLTLSCLCVVFITVILAAGRMLQIRQKTRNTQQRRTYMGSRQRPSDTQAEPTVYVSPANLPPPPKYEAMAPPSYEEVVGIHYPGYQAPQPITQPITTALAQSSNSTSETENSPNNSETTRTATVTPSTVITVTDERTRVTVS